MIMATRKNYLDVTQKAGKSIWVVIPVRNEEASLPLVLRELPTVSRIIIADNGSTDHSRQVAEDFGAQVVYEPQPGYGKACLTGLAEISRRIDAGETAPEIVVFIDGDYSDFPEYLTQLVEPILNGSQDFVLGSRLMGEREPGAMPLQSIYGNMLACGLMRLLWGTRYTDLGPFRAISWRALESLRMEDQNFGWTVEMQIKAAIAKLRILELPVPYRKRVGVSKISGTISGTFRAGYKILWTIGKYAWLMRGWSPQIADGRKPSCEYMELSTHTQDGSRRAAKWLFIGRR
jgi:glycosyltransferase involved in cell wall biosynthesis